MIFPILIITLGWAINIFFRMKYSLHMMQIEMYDNPKYMNWVNKNKDKIYTKKTKVFVIATVLMSYVYLCYGIHHLFNIVTNEKDQADAVLIRAVEPISGIDIMCQRRGMDKPRPNLTSGPGKLTQALGISVQQNGIYLLGSRVWLEEMAPIHPSKIVVSQRIGVDYAKEDALKPWRFYIKDNPWISRK